MPKRSNVVQVGVFKGLPANFVSRIGEPSHLSAEPGYADCWPWKGIVMGGGDTSQLPYGRMRTWLSKETLVHRIVYEWKNGPFLKSLKVLHLCNYSLCCNPRHLKLGTQKENMQHMAACKRSANVKGVRNPKSILGPDQVLKVREAYAAGRTAHSISLDMKLELGTVAALVLREPKDKSRFKHWAEVGGPMRPDEFRRKTHDKFGMHACEIRLGYQDGSTINALAQRWNASPGQISMILRGLSHADRSGPIFNPPLRWGTCKRGRSVKRLVSVAHAVRVAYKNFGTVNALAEKLGVSPKSITNILLGRSYTNAGGPIATRPLRYSDFTIRPIRVKPSFVVRTQHLVDSGRFSGLSHSVVRKIGEPISRKDAMGYKNCWPWTGFKKSGYGGGRKMAHVLLYEWANGPLTPGEIVMHLCNQRDCCNPEHLKAGTLSENMQYMATSGRASRLTGEKSPVSRFTSAVVLEVRNRYASGAALATIAAQMGFSCKDIDHLIQYDYKRGRYKFWKEVGGPLRLSKHTDTRG